MTRSRKPATVLGTKANFPGFIEPALATMIEKPLSGERWVHEIKFDGYRVQVHLHAANVKVFTTNQAQSVRPCSFPQTGRFSTRTNAA
jgi:ATP-dependent DNA ligase